MLTGTRVRNIDGGLGRPVALEKPGWMTGLHCYLPLTRVSREGQQWVGSTPSFCSDAAVQWFNAATVCKLPHC